MTTPKYDYYTPGQSPREERMTYFDVLKKVDELADTLLAREVPIAKDEFHRVSDPTILSLVPMPVELARMDLACIRFEFQEYRDQDIPYANTTVVLEFNEGECRISEPKEASNTIAYDFIPTRKRGAYGEIQILAGTLEVRQFSNIIAKTILPWSDASVSDFTRLDLQGARDEIKELLDGQKNVSSTRFYKYVYDGEVISIAVEDGHIREVSIEQPGFENDSHTVTLRTNFETNSHTQKIYISDENGQKEKHVTSVEIQAFCDILDDLLEQLAPEDESHESHSRSVIVSEFQDRKAPEEREKFI